MTRTEKPVDLDTATLGRWLDTQDAPGAGEEPAAEVLKGGSQNMLYRINRGGQGMVLRMPGPRADERRLGELLREIRADPRLHDALVFVLTTSKSDEDKMSSYGFNVAGYIVKSDAGAGFIRLVELLDHYWRIVEFP